MDSNDYKHELNRWLKAHKIAEEAAARIADGRPPGEEGELGRFLREDPDAKELIDRLSDTERLSHICANGGNEKIRAEASRLLAAIEKQGSRRKQRLRKFYIWSAAAAAAVVFGLVLIPRLLPGKSGSLEIAWQVPEGSPLLIVGDNEDVIDLSSLNGALTASGAMVSNNKDRILKYMSEAGSDDLAQTTMNRLLLPAHYTYAVVLDDGTEIHLNANSELKYPDRFTGDTREVELVGEAYFNVAHSEKPFIVHVGDMSLQVYGTRFNVNGYGGHCVKTVLIEGSVGIRATDTKEIILKPDQLCAYNSDESTFAVHEVAAENYILWIQHMFHYSGQPLASIINDLSAWYGITFEGDNTDDVLLSLYVSRELPLEETLKFIESITADVKFTRKEDRYEIKRKNT